MISILRSAVISSVLFSAQAVAQQPGSAEYNRVFLPAHGVGDTTPQIQKWGAVARGGRQHAWLVRWRRHREGGCRAGCARLSRAGIAGL